jgi:hypothetical protein
MNVTSEQSVSDRRQLALTFATSVSGASILRVDAYPLVTQVHGGSAART